MANSRFKVGDIIKIYRMDDAGGKDTAARAYDGRTGVIEHIDSIGQLHGIWGSLAVCPEVDKVGIIFSK